MVICKASHQHVAQTAMYHSFDHESVAAEVAHDEQHRHQHDAHADDAVASINDSDHYAEQNLSKCSACAACCAGTVWMAAEVPSLPIFRAVPSRGISDFVFHIPGVVPDQPEHPPRLLSACVILLDLDWASPFTMEPARLRLA
jgi:hypothetical protein